MVAIAQWQSVWLWIRRLRVRHPLATLGQWANLPKFKWVWLIGSLVNWLIDLAPVAQRIEHQSSELSVRGSSPFRRTFKWKSLVFSRRLLLYPLSHSRKPNTTTNRHDLPKGVSRVVFFKGITRVSILKSDSQPFAAYHCLVRFWVSRVWTFPLDAFPQQERR